VEVQASCASCNSTS